MPIQLNPLIIFQQYGFVEQRPRSNNHACGRCPFCNKDVHFFINVDEKKWDCKKCGRSGGYKMFLEQIVEIGQKNFTGLVAKRLVDNRGIAESTFKMVKTGWLPLVGIYILPTYSKDGKTILNMKRFDLIEMRNAAGSHLVMYGLWLFPDQFDTVFVAEGEWDALVFLEIITKLKLKGTVVIGVPGAGSFKPEVLPFLTGKNVYLFYDNDMAGKNGKLRALNLIAGVTGKIYSINWPKGSPDGWDVRDVYKKEKGNAETTLKYLKSLSSLYDVQSSTTSKIDADIIKGDPIPVQQVYNVFQKHLHLPDTDVLDVVFGTVIGNRIPGDPIWMFIVGPPGSTKTVPLIALTGCPRIHAWTGITPHVLISGMNLQGGIDPSLIPQLNDGIWVDKDFTSIIGLPNQEQNEIFSILRDAYDGECSKPFGNGMRRRIKSHFGILAAVTPVIEQFVEEHASLGERFLRWENKLPKGIKARDPYVRKALSNVGKEPEIQAEFNNIAKQVLLAEYDANSVIVSDEISTKIVNISHWTATLRGTVTRDKYGRDHDIIFKSFTELATRISKEMYKLAKGIALFRGMKEVDNSIYRILVHVARSSIQTRYDEVMEIIYQKELAVIAEIIKHVGLPRNTIEFILENLSMLGAIDKSLQGAVPIYRVKSEILEIINSCEIYQWNGSSGGTANCIKYAEKKKREIIFIDPNELPK
jgi:hypothetical protein